MARIRSRRYQKAAEKVDRNRRYPVIEGLALIKSLVGPKFDETIDVAVRIGIDAKKTDQLVRGSVSLPKGTGKSVKIAVFAEGDRAKDALAAGADFVGSADLADKIEKGWTDFDMTIASPDMMKYVGKLGKVLGPQGKMPSPKAGTVTPNVAAAVREFKAGKIEFRTDAGANVHAAIGKKSFQAEDLAANLTAFLDHLRTLRPSQAKGEFIKKVVVSASMGPGVALAVQ
ncbi:MAG: 50S ribosomal protein L1 [Phycisphaerales bacterium]|jgi:large subunit ribosomal protein L1|nr:50S ribosomal protein L1 [Phycisphaerales bacterium]